jgi:two-component system sensor histidine kinase/response regulator
MFDRTGRVLWENHAARCTFPDRDGERPSLNARVARPEARSALAEGLAHGRAVTLEMELETHLGPRWALVDARSTTDGTTGQRASLVVHSDIHRWKTAELALREAKAAAERANRSKSEFLANMSHEIRTPMNGVLGNLELLGRSRLDPTQARHVELTRRSARMLLAILDDILDLSRIDAGRLSVERAPFDLREVVEDVLSLHRENASRKGLSLSLDIAPRVPRRVVSDPVRISQVLGNLTSNAIKFTERGGVTVRVRCPEETEAEVHLRFEVEDTGPGIEASRLGAIFQPFEQADGSVTRRYGGTGLGLTISQKLTRLLGGETFVESELGRGSTFGFRLRLPVPSEAGTTLDVEPEEDLGSKEAWVLAPSPEARRALVTCLEGLSLSTRSFETVAALEEGASQASPPSVGLVDLDDVAPSDVARAASAVPRLVGWTRAAAARPPEVAALIEGDVDPGATYACLSRLLGGRREVLAEPPSPALEDSARVLLVEDNAINREVALAMLETLGCEVETAEDGASAVEAASRGRFDVILMDCQMPGMDGFTATRRIRELEAGRGPRTPIVALTANAMTGDRERCLAAGMDDFVAKPVELEHLEAKLAAWLRAHHPGTGSPR